MAKTLGLASAYLLKAAEVATDFREIKATTSVDEVDTTTFQDTNRSFIPGYGSGEHSLAGLWKAGAGSSHEVLQDLLDDTAAAVATFCPEGVTENKKAMLLSASATAYEISVPGDAVALTAALAGSGGAKWGLLIKVADVSTTANGTSYDNPSDAATTKGAAFHLHVTANTRDAGTLDVTIEDSANGTDFASITGLTAFTQVAALATTSERKTLANGLTLRRYVRAVVTVGAGASGSYSVRVAVQRNF